MGIKHNMEGKYEDIINYEYNGSKRRPHMSKSDRAAQFSPFAALTGFGDAVDEVGRLTDFEVILDENQYEVLDRKINMLMNKQFDNDVVKVVYFVPDERKNGGKYKEITGNIKSINKYDRKIVMSDGLTISIDDIIDIKGSFENCIEE